MPTGIVFLFGAGASVAAGSGDHVSPETPPLMAELYDRLARDFPQEWGPSSSLAQHADKFRSDFEKAFTDEVLRQRPPFADPPTLNLLEAQRPLAKHFARYRLKSRSENLYSQLLGDLQAADAIQLTTFGSLNYDTLFEQAAAAMGFGIDWLVDEAMNMLQPNGVTLSPRPDAIRVAKLHGSSNFVTKLDEDYRAIAAPGVMIEMAITTLAPAELAIPGEAERVFGGDDCFPVMSQVSPDKKQLLAPSKMQQIRSIWSQAVAAAASVIVIGVSPRQHDRHVWDPIQATRASMSYIGAEPDFATWSSLNPERWRHIAVKWERPGQGSERLR